MKMKENIKSKYIGFRCPIKLYEEKLKNEKNMSKTITNALQRDYGQNMIEGFIQYSNLFHLLEKHFKNRHTLKIEEFINFINLIVKNPDVIDKTEKRLKEEDKLNELS